MIIFKKIKYKNFLSTGNTPVEIQLDKSDITLILGENGAGKSTMLDAICVGMFNRPFRSIKKEQIVNTINNGDCEIEIDFSVGSKNYKIIRGIKPTKFEIYIDGDLLDQNASNLDYQKYLENNIIKLDYRSFVQVVLLGSRNWVSFMRLRPRHRREVVQEILDIKVFGVMDRMLRDQQTSLSKQIVELTHQCDLIENKHELETKHYKELSGRDNTDKENKEKQLEKYDETKHEYEKKIVLLDAEIQSYKKQIVNQDSTRKKLTKLSKIESKIETNIFNHRKNLEFFENNESCPTCTQEITPEKRGERKAHEKAKIDLLNDGVKELTNEIRNTETKITEFDGIVRKINELNIELAKIDTSVEELDKYSDNIHRQLMSMNTNEDKKIEEELKELETKLNETKVELNQIVENKKYIDVLRELMGDSGAKSKIIKKYIPIMNNLANQYLNLMGFFCNFELDEEFNEQLNIRGRDKMEYNHLSEGEKLRIDLALMFTWRGVAKLKNSVNTNLLILDEVLDSSLDNQGLDEFIKIIKRMENENIFIISHRGDVLIDKFNDAIRFTKQSNFSRLTYV